MDDPTARFSLPVASRVPDRPERTGSIRGRGKCRERTQEG